MITNAKNQPTMFVACGPSGSGKSTLFAKLQQTNPELVHYSWDALRLEWYDPTNYSNAWKLACEDKTFDKRAKQYLVDLVNQGKDIFVDNVNTTVKARKAFFAVLPHQPYDYRMVAYAFNVDLDTLLARQSTRPDKSVPEFAVRRQFDVYVKPTEQEGFDEVIYV